jgi:hypothetical protein
MINVYAEWISVTVGSLGAANLRPLRDRLGNLPVLENFEISIRQ